MKKNLLVASLLLTNLIFAQNKIKFGFNGGLTYSSFRGNEIIEQDDPELAFLAGLFIEYPLKQNLSLKAGINYEKKSTSFEVEVNNNIGLLLGIVKAYTDFEFLALPILLNFKFGNSDNIFINGGPFLGYLLSSKTKPDGFPEEDNTNRFKKFDLGFSLGIGKTFVINDTNYLSLEIRNSLGLNNISKGRVINDGSIKSNALNLILGWSFNL